MIEIVSKIKNMVSIVSSYIKNNIKPKIFVLGTKISNVVKYHIEN